MKKPQVTVIGAGVVGVCSAAWLQREGFKVTLIDAGPVGEGASFGNAGNLSPGAVVPYMIPGFWKELPGWLAQNGPLAVRPAYFLTALPWLLTAVKTSRAETAMQTSRAMHELHRGTLEAYAELTRGTGAAALIERCGQLYVSTRENAAQGSTVTQSMRKAAGVKYTLLDHMEIRELEPALAPIFKSGMLLPDNGRCKNPHELVRLIAAEAGRHGATIQRGTVTGFQTNGRHVTGIVVDGVAQAVECVVIAAGAASGQLSAWLGTPLPVEAERGYHVTIEEPGVMPRIPVSHVDAKFVCSPMNMGLRVAGTAEFAGYDAAPDWRRAEMLVTQARTMFPGLNLAKVSRWMGRRPSLPDGLPVLGIAPNYTNAFFAFGNSHFGMSAGPVMGKVAAELVAGRPPHIAIAPFAPARFARGARRN